MTLLHRGTLILRNQYKQDMHVTVSLFPSSIDGVGCLKVAISDAGRAENKLREGTEKAPSVNGEMQISRAVDN